MTEGGKKIDQNHPDYVEFTRHTFQENIMLCDAKSGILMGFGTVFLLWCFDRVLGENGAALPPLVAGVERFLYAAAIAALVVTISLTWMVIRPRISKANDFIYWGSSVFKQPEAAFMTAIMDADNDVLGRDMLRQLHVLAGICRTKYENFRRAVLVAEFSAALIFLALCVRLGGNIIWAG